jgi:hypothetical protein
VINNSLNNVCLKNERIKTLTSFRDFIATNIKLTKIKLMHAIVRNKLSAFDVQMRAS